MQSTNPIITQLFSNCMPSTKRHWISGVQSTLLSDLLNCVWLLLFLNIREESLLIYLYTFKPYIDVSYFKGHLSKWQSEASVSVQPQQQATYPASACLNATSRQISIPVRSTRLSLTARRQREMKLLTGNLLVYKLLLWKISNRSTLKLRFWCL